MRVLLLVASLLLGAAPFLLGAAESLFADPVRARGKGVEIRQSEIEESFLAYQAARAAMGQPVPSALDDQVKEQVLEKLVATKLLLARATPADREAGSRIAERVIEEGRRKASSEASYRRQLIAVGTTPEKYEADILEQAIVKAVIDRELKNRHPVTAEDLRAYYDKHDEMFGKPEQVRVAHILLSVREFPSGELLPVKAQAAQKVKAEQVLAQAQAGEDFATLIQKFSEDPDVENTQGILAFPRNGPVPLEFEAAAFSLELDQVSGLVRSVLGFHIIKLLERIPAERIPLEQVEPQIRSILQEQYVQQHLEAHLETLKREAALEILPVE